MKAISHHYFALYKPDGYLSQFLTNDRHAKRKKFLGSLHNFPNGTMAVGRLDEPSEGLLLLTTNGKYSTHINKSGIEKEYYAQVDGVITSAAIDHLKKGVTITVKDEPYITKKAMVEKIETPLLPARNKKIRDDRHGPTSWVSITITEGKFRQIRKMTSAVGFPTLRLVRYRIGKFTIHGMDKGDVKVINVKFEK
ncbi:pseudouridine synthase [Patiriisocius marinistellae]|uniref:Pseudouridine synthase n=1 Tax=Patiriisocius marinistellae TaxID=2494560 RepID=A0A5J4G2G6_9FLAO|nr:pseudouridine synthase [Patiriisocius marinistellae]GEQ86371.1 pseudouridine synthase [Patiriisocius marinistellae]